MTKVRTARNQDLQTVPVVSLNCDSGKRVAVNSDTSTASGLLDAGVYLISTNTNVYVRIGQAGAAGDLPGSFVLSAGAGAYFEVSQNDRVFARALEDDGAIFIIGVK